jgi:hypothetical protein
MRTFPSPDTGGAVETSVQVIWVDCLPDADLGLFSDDDIWRGAVFDALVGHADRGGHNWLAVPASGPSCRLKLIDHGYGFPEVAGPPSSAFYELRRGQALPAEILASVETILARPQSLNPLRELLSPAAVDALTARAETLVSLAVLEIPGA